MSLPYKHEYISRAKELRKNMTDEEKHLWYDFLSKQSLRFQRQKTIGGFIADFYCHKARLIIEIDGSQHYTVDGHAYDLERTKILNNYGVKVLRFSNSEVNNNFINVCERIESFLPQSH